MTTLLNLFDDTETFTRPDYDPAERTQRIPLFTAYGLPRPDTTAVIVPVRPQQGRVKGRHRRPRSAVPGVIVFLAAIVCTPLVGAAVAWWAR